MLKSPGKLIAALVVLGLGVTGLGIYLALRPAQSPQEKVNQAEQGSQTVSDSGRNISALGRLEPEGRVLKVSAPTASMFGSARVAQLLVREGSTVKAGQVIAVMDTRDRLLAAAMEAEARVREAQVKVGQAQTGAKRAEVAAQVEQVRARQAQAMAAQAEVERRFAELKNAEAEYQRYQTLYKDGALSKSDLDTRALTLQTSQSALKQSERLRDQAALELRQAQQQQASLESVRPIDVQAAEAQLQVAIANFQKAKAELETAAVRSPIDGKVIKVHAYPGEQVGTDGVVEVGNTNRMYAVAEIYETDIGKIKLGQRAKITSPAFEGEVEGVVAVIGQKIDKNDVLNTDPAADTDARVVEVKIQLAESQKVAGLTNLQVKVVVDPNAPLYPTPQRPDATQSPERSPNPSNGDAAISPKVSPSPLIELAPRTNDPLAPADKP